MPLEGSISVNVQFRDTTSSTGVQSLKTITLQEGTEYTTGKVAVVSGTVGTSTIAVSSAPTTYRDASGQIVSFSDLQRVVCKATRPCNFGDGGSDCVAQTFCMFSTIATPDIDIVPGYTAGTASYTIVMYGT